MNKKTVDDSELQKVIADFLDMGHVENIIAMFCHEQKYYQWTGILLIDGRFNVRLGMNILFEELQKKDAKNTIQAIPSLLKVLQHPEALYRGEALSLLAIIGTRESIPQIRKCLTDESPQVREMARMALEDIS